MSAKAVTSMMGSIADIGRDATRGGYSRPVYSGAEVTLREWFVAEAEARGLEVQEDRNGILWAWWDLVDDLGVSAPRQGALVTGSHLDSVPGGGAFDGPLGVASALAAVDLLKQREAAGALHRERPLAVAVFPEEEGSRFGIACLGSRLLTGAISAERALQLKDQDGNTFADLVTRNGLDPARIGADPESMGLIGEFVELHVEQGRGLGALEPVHAVCVGSSILGHGRWRLSIHGQGNHAGTTLMEDRADPMVAAAETILGVRKLAAAIPDARATVGRLVPVPGGTNVIASRVDLWLDARHPDDAVTADLVGQIHRFGQEVAAATGCTFQLLEESYSGTVHFEPGLMKRLDDAVQRTAPGAPRLATGAGHDAGVLASHVPTGMIFVRNPSGISHSPEEYVEDDDAELGAVALADALAGLLESAGSPA